MFGWILLAVASAVIFIVTVAFILPKFLLQNRYKIKKIQDRGIGKFKTATDERALMFEPAISARKYVKQYLLIDREDKKFLVCQTAPGVAYLEYDIVLFNGNNKVFRVINVRDVIDESGLTKEVSLPVETSYVSLLLNVANGEKLGKRLKAMVSPLKAMAFMLITLVLSVAVAFCLKVSCSNLFGGVFRESFMNSSGGNIFTAILAVALCTIGIVAVSVVLAVRNICISKVRRKNGSKR